MRQHLSYAASMLEDAVGTQVCLGFLDRELFFVEVWRAWSLSGGLGPTALKRGAGNQPEIGK